jgi:proline dehydrogenase
MKFIRSLILAASQNAWLRQHAANYPFVRRSVSRFMPGETFDEALAAAFRLQSANIATIFTALGENIKDAGEASQVADHYSHVLERIAGNNLNAEISVKLTQLGLDFSPDFCYLNLQKIIALASKQSIVWIDMESSIYVDRTLQVYRRILHEHSNVGICLQAYLRRTRADVDDLLALKPSLRVVKGAYDEAPKIALVSKREVDDNYFNLAKALLHAQQEKQCVRAAFGTHDMAMIRRIQEFAKAQGMAASEVEFQMLYGIQRNEQERLAKEGYRSGVLLSYGPYWYPWFMRRLAERPANLGFLLRQIFKH